MKYSWKQITEMALSTLSQKELQQSAVYIKPALLQSGTTIPMNRQSLHLTVPSVMVFVDLSPGANWGHSSRYLLIAPETGEIQTIESQFPPSREELKLVHKGEKVENWMLLTVERLE